VILHGKEEEGREESKEGEEGEEKVTFVFP
jgi:hypothetical protein